MTRIDGHNSGAISAWPDALDQLASISTAPPKNSLQTIPLDRLEVGHLPGMRRAHARWAFGCASQDRCRGCAVGHDRRRGAAVADRRRGAAVADRQSGAAVADDRRAQRTATRRREGLSASQQRERQRVASPPDGIGFAFGSAEVTPERLQRWLGGLTEPQREALAHPRTVISVTAGTSAVGSLRYNQRLAAARGSSVTAALRRLGFEGEVKVELAVEPDRGNDDADRRVATLSIYSGNQRFRDYIKALGARERARASARARAGVRTAGGRTAAAAGEPTQVRSFAQLPVNVRAQLTRRIIDHGTTDRPLRIAGYAILSHPVSGRMGGVEVDRLREGRSELLGNFVFRRGNEVQIQPRYPETASQLRQTARRHRIELSDRQVRQRSRAFALLNQLWRHHLRRGLSIEEARHYVRRDASLELRLQTLQLVELGLGAL